MTNQNIKIKIHPYPPILNTYTTHILFQPLNDLKKKKLQRFEEEPRPGPFAVVVWISVEYIYKKGNYLPFDWKKNCTDFPHWCGWIQNAIT